MSLPEQEARALQRARWLLSGIGSGLYKITTITQLRADARDVMKHYPLDAEGRWMESYGDNPECTRTATRLEVYAKPDTREIT